MKASRIAALAAVALISGRSVAQTIPALPAEPQPCTVFNLGEGDSVQDANSNVSLSVRISPDGKMADISGYAVSECGDCVRPVMRDIRMLNLLADRNTRPLDAILVEILQPNPADKPVTVTPPIKLPIGVEMPVVSSQNEILVGLAFAAASASSPDVILNPDYVTQTIWACPVKPASAKPATGNLVPR